MASTQTPTAQVKLQPGLAPITKTGLTLYMRALATGNPANIVMQAVLLQGGSAITPTLTSGLLSTTFTTFQLAVADSDAAKIIDFTNLNVQFWGFSSTGEATTIEVSDVYLSMPTAAAFPEPILVPGRESFGLAFINTAPGRAAGW